MNLTNIRADVRYLIFANNADTNYSDTDIDRNINNWYRRVLIWILTTNGHWQVNGERATTDLVANQREYILPSDIMKINEVYIKTSVNDKYIKAKQRDAREFNQEPDTDNYTPYVPEFDLTDNSIFVYLPSSSIPDCAEGIKIHYQTEITALSAGGNTPNLAEPFEKLIVYGAAYDYCVANELTSKGEKLKREIRELKDDLLEFYANRSTVEPVIIKPIETNYY